MYKIYNRQVYFYNLIYHKLGLIPNLDPCGSINIFPIMVGRILHRRTLMHISTFLHHKWIPERIKSVRVQHFQHYYRTPELYWPPEFHWPHRWFSLVNISTSTSSSYFHYFLSWVITTDAFHVLYMDTAWKMITVPVIPLGTPIVFSD